MITGSPPRLWPARIGLPVVGAALLVLAGMALSSAIDDSGHILIGESDAILLNTGQGERHVDVRARSEGFPRAGADAVEIASGQARGGAAWRIVLFEDGGRSCLEAAVDGGASVYCDVARGEGHVRSLHGTVRPGAVNLVHGFVGPEIGRVTVGDGTDVELRALRDGLGASWDEDVRFFVAEVPLDGMRLKVATAAGEVVETFDVRGAARLEPGERAVP